MPAKGSKFILEHLKQRIATATSEELDLAYKSMDFVGVFLNQLDNWLLNFLEVQMFGAGEKFFLSLICRDRLDISFEMVLNDPQYVTVKSTATGGWLCGMYSLKDLRSAKEAGQRTMENIGPRVGFRGKK